MGPGERYTVSLVLLSVYVFEDLETENIDAKCGFLNGLHYEEAYMFPTSDDK